MSEGVSAAPASATPGTHFAHLHDQATQNSKPLFVADFLGTAEGIHTRRLTMEGFRALGILATFFAGLQAQMLSASLSDNSTIAAKLVNACWLSGVFLDVFGAVLATATARWFEVLNPQHVEIYHKSQSRRNPAYTPFLDWIIAKALFSALGVVAFGVTMFIIGLVIFVWEKQPLLVSIISTTPVAILTPLLAVLFYPHSRRKENIMKILAENRGAW